MRLLQEHPPAKLRAGLVAPSRRLWAEGEGDWPSVKFCSTSRWGSKDLPFRSAAGGFRSQAVKWDRNRQSFEGFPCFHPRPSGIWHPLTP